jgi:cell division control protein 42
LLFPKHYNKEDWSNFIPEKTQLTLARIGTEPYTLGLFDTHGQEDFDRLRPLSYPGTDVFIICATIGVHKEYKSAVSKWAPELQHHCPNVPIILLGVKENCDYGPIHGPKNATRLGDDFNYGRGIAEKIGALKYLECDPLTQQGLKSAFDEVCIQIRRRGVYPANQNY